MNNHKATGPDEHQGYRLLPKDKGSDMKAFITITKCNMWDIA